MHSSTSSSDRTPPHDPGGVRLWLSLFALGFVVVAALLACSIFTRAPYGDLARLGALSEASFGWRDAQPAVDPQQLVSSSIEQADILVVGDSFSVEAGPHPRSGLVWQSRLVAAGWRVATLHWDRARPLCPDFHPWLANTGFRGRWVLLESVERALDDRLTAPSPCSTNARPMPSAFSVGSPGVLPPPAALNLGEKLLTGVSTAWNTWRALRTEAPAVFQDPSAADGVRLEPYPTGCQRFSHAACDRALFLLDDEKKPLFDAKHLPWMAATPHPTQGWSLAWVIVPNKRTFYLHPAAFASLSAALQAQRLGPDVMAALKSQGAESRDIYFPNDTHLSPRGSLLMGDAVVHWLKQQTSH